MENKIEEILNRHLQGEELIAFESAKAAMEELAAGASQPMSPEDWKDLRRLVLSHVTLIRILGTKHRTAEETRFLESAKEVHKPFDNPLRLASTPPAACASPALEQLRKWVVEQRNLAHLNCLEEQKQAYNSVLAFIEASTAKTN